MSTGGIEVEGRVHWWDRSGGACHPVRVFSTGN